MLSSLVISPNSSPSDASGRFGCVDRSTPPWSVLTAPAHRSAPARPARRRRGRAGRPLELGPVPVAVVLDHPHAGADHASGDEAGPRSHHQEQPGPPAGEARHIAEHALDAALVEARGQRRDLAAGLVQVVTQRPGLGRASVGQRLQLARQRAQPLGGLRAALGRLGPQLGAGLVDQVPDLALGLLHDRAGLLGRRRRDLLGLVADGRGDVTGRRGRGVGDPAHLAAAAAIVAVITAVVPTSTLGSGGSSSGRGSILLTSVAAIGGPSTPGRCLSKRTSSRNPAIG